MSNETNNIGVDVDKEVERAAKLRRKGSEKHDHAKGEYSDECGYQYEREACPLGCGEQIRDLSSHLLDCPEA